MNIPARYCTGYLGDIGVPVDPAPMDFSAWYEVFLDGRWFTLDARHNHPRIGRVVIAKGRDAADVAISTAFGVAQLARFQVITEELVQQDKDNRIRSCLKSKAADPLYCLTSPKPRGSSAACGSLLRLLIPFPGEPS